MSPTLSVLEGTPWYIPVALIVLIGFVLPLVTLIQNKRQGKVITKVHHEVADVPEDHGTNLREDIEAIPAEVKRVLGEMITKAIQDAMVPWIAEQQEQRKDVGGLRDDFRTVTKRVDFYAIDTRDQITGIRVAQANSDDTVDMLTSKVVQLDARMNEQRESKQ